jgi:Fe(3+) dicitrate transport protein
MFFTLIASRSALGILNYINRADPLQERDLWIDNFRNFGNETRLLYKYNLGNHLSSFLVGFRYYNGFTDRRQGLGNDGREGNRSDFEFLRTENEDFSSFIFPNSNQSFFAENVFSVNSKLSITPGIRLENIRTNANGFYYETNRDLAGNIILNRKIEETRADNRSFVLMGIGASYQALPDMEFYSNISQNYRSINFNDIRIVNPNLQVDPNIRDEKGMTSDLGVRGSVKNYLNYDISLFMIRYNDRIGSILISDTVSYIPYRFRTNISDSRNAGLETFVEADLWKLIWGSEAKTQLSLFSNFSWIDARYINSIETAYNNRKVELVPNVILKTGLNFKRNSLSLSYQFSYVSSQYTDASNAEFTSNAVNGIIPAYTVMDLSSEYSYKNFTLAAGVNNLSNNMYFTRRADGYPGPGIIPSDGRSFYLTLQLKL